MIVMLQDATVVFVVVHSHDSWSLAIVHIARVASSVRHFQQPLHIRVSSEQGFWNKDGELFLGLAM